MTTNTSTRVRIADAVYSRPTNDNHGRPMVAVEYDDGDRLITYAVPDAVLAFFGGK